MQRDEHIHSDGADELFGAPPPATATDGAEIKVNWLVFVGAAALVLGLALWALLAPENADAVIGGMVDWITSYFGWWYFSLAAALIAFVLLVCLSRVGRYKLGPEESKPAYSMFTWTAMLFSAGIGIDLMFYSVAEPVAQYLAPPVGEGQNIEAARMAITWTLFHYGISGWSMYALMGMALGYFSFRHGLPLSIRSALYPIIGKRVHGRLGDAVDLAAVLGTIFGIATSLGIGIVQLNFGLKVMFGIEEGKAAQVGLIVMSVVLGTISAVSGVDKGIRRLSELNVLLSLSLMLFVLVAGQTSFLLNSLVMNVGDYLTKLPGLALDTLAYDQPADWMSTWTLFFWAWWVAWSPFVGLFLARISRGRTIRQFLVGVLIIPFAFTLLWISIFGNSAIAIIRDGNAGFGQLTYDSPQAGFYTFLQLFPWAAVVVAVASLTGFLYYVTSADSGALVMGNFTSRLPHPMADCAPWIRIFWSVAIGLLTIAMLFAGGGTSITTLTNATIVMGLPFSFVLALVAVGLWRSLRRESYKLDTFQLALPGAISAGRTGNVHGSALAADEPQSTDRVQLTVGQRLRRALSYPDQAQMREFLADSVTPALQRVAAELETHGQQAQVEQLDDGVQLLADLGAEPSFLYRVAPVKAQAPAFGTRSQRESNTYFRAEVHLAEGSQGYSLNGYTEEQVMGDVLDQYERHLSYLHLVRNHQT
ncbi:MAG TPA: choline BCCT transporter BetT [Actinophytocola sp.]|nr:choline BCCT transporter BetT [Actinophytocola sp.]